MLLDIAICFRALQLYTHYAHHLCAHATFHQDHEFFSELYNFAEDNYDALIERQIGTVSDQINLMEIMTKVNQKLSQLQTANVKENKTFYLESLKLVDYLLSELEKSKVAPISVGTQNLLQDMADKLEVFKYKIKRRVS